MKIPKTIHQIYDYPSEFPDILSDLPKSWKREHPTWEYYLWEHKKIQNFLSNNFSQFIPIYNSFHYNKQRWELLRYLILYHFGGLYVDMDYECLQPIDSLLENHLCCLGLEPAEHADRFGKQDLIGNAMLATVPHYPFFKQIIEKISLTVDNRQRVGTWLISQTTGIEMLNKVYEEYESKKDITLLLTDLIAPLSAKEISLFLMGRETADMENKVENAFAIHYFLGQWRLKSILYHLNM